MIDLRLRYLLPLLFVVAFCLRTPTLGLPLEGASALLAAKAVDGDLLASGSAPLLPALTRGVSALGLSPTAALRLLDVLCAAVLAPLAVLLALGLGLSRARAAVVGVLLALHPLALTAAAGVAPGSASLATALTLGALTGLTTSRPAAIRAGALCTLLLAASDGAALFLGPVLLWSYVRRENAPRLQTAVVMLGLGLLAAAPLTWFRWGDLGAGPSLSTALLWLVGATLGVLLPALAVGLMRLARAGGAAHAWLLGSAAAAAAALLGAPVPALILLPLVVLAGVEGLVVWSAAWRRRFTPATVGGALLVSLWLVSGGLQTRLAPDEPAAAGRLHLLREAMRTAADTAGEQGWIVLAVGAEHPEEQASLADLQPEHWTWIERAGAAHAGARRRLLVFPAKSFESGRSVAIVAPAGRAAGIHTFDGAGIYQQEVVREVGPYVVLRARRP